MVTEKVWETMQKDGRSKYWTPELIDKPVKKAAPKKEKEKVVIERIKVSKPKEEKVEEEPKSEINENKENDGTN